MPRPGLVDAEGGDTAARSFVYCSRLLGKKAGCRSGASFPRGKLNGERLVSAVCRRSWKSGVDGVVGSLRSALSDAEAPSGSSRKASPWADGLDSDGPLWTFAISRTSVSAGPKF